MQVVVMGRLLGTADAWDGDLGECVWYENFQPNAGVNLPSGGSLQIDFEKGLLGISCLDTGEILNPIDAVPFLNSINKENQ